MLGFISGGGGGRRRRKQQQPTSMGRALLLLSIATTSTNAFTSCSTSAISTTIINQQSKSALQYRYGNDDYQPIDIQQFNINSAAMHRRRRSHHMSSRRPSKPTPSPSPPTQRPTIELEQEMDEYIEYLDRRYTRMHPKRSPSKIVYKYFNLQGKILSSLLPSPTSSGSSNKDHTIKILGLSGLASKRLRQRLHVVSATTTASRRRRMSKKAVSTTRSSSSSSSAIVMRPQSISDKIVSSIRSICNFFSLNIIPELFVDKTSGFSMASLAMLLLIRPLWSTFRQS